MLAIYVIVVLPVALKDPLLDILIYASLQGLTIFGFGFWIYRTIKNGLALRQQFLQDWQTYPETFLTD